MNHQYTHIHKIHHGPNLGEATIFPFIIFFVISHGGYIQMSFFWDFQLLVVKSKIDTLTPNLRSAITYVISIQMDHASPF
jgi:hypothetical protein